jgi:6-pyruvoyltetrahydropterin/6-carboxytetrahydropterin synthase
VERSSGRNMKVGTNWKRFTAGHRVAWHPKCHRMHGHGFMVRVLVEGEVDVKTGMIVDFGVIGDAISELIDPLDHKFLAPQSVKDVGALESGISGLLDAGAKYVIDGKYVLPKEDVVVLPVDIVTTEALAKYFLSRLCEKLWAVGKTVTVQVSETGENIAEASQHVPKNKTKIWNVLPDVWTSTTVSGDWHQITFDIEPTPGPVSIL